MQNSSRDRNATIQEDRRQTDRKRQWQRPESSLCADVVRNDLPMCPRLRTANLRGHEENRHRDIYQEGLACNVLG